MQDEEKLKERISLLTRFFWLDDLFKIGRELHLPFFDKISNYWEMNQYQAAAEIAKSITDDVLQKLTGKYVPRYGLILGGFHGRYYTATVTGELKFEDSTDLIRTNVQRALKSWGDKAYGLLQALINRNGRAGYFDLINEMERVLGYEFVPSYLLPRLAPLNLVFRTGSNKYPDWSMPSEIIPVVQEELGKFKRPSQPALGKVSVADKLLRLERESGVITDKIVQARRNLNLLSEHRFGTKLFRENELATADIRKPCSNEEDFNNRIMTLAILIGEIESEGISALIKKGKPDPGSINVLEYFLQEYVPNFDKTAIKNLRMIVSLRSKKYPVHVDDPEFISAMNYFGITSFPPDWQELWEKTLQRYLESLELLVRSISQLS
jgi:hypothetical protein